MGQHEESTDHTLTQLPQYEDDIRYLQNQNTVVLNLATAVART